MKQAAGKVTGQDDLEEEGKASARARQGRDAGREARGEGDRAPREGGRAPRGVGPPAQVARRAHRSRSEVPRRGASLLVWDDASDEGAPVKLGMIGLGRMGGNMAARLRERGHDVVGYSRSRPSDVDTLEELAAALEPPRVVWLMVPAGDATESTLDVARRAAVVRRPRRSTAATRTTATRSAAPSRSPSAAIAFIDAGVSGGIWGRELGYCLMVGGRRRRRRPRAAGVRRPRATRTGSPTADRRGPGTSRRWCTTGSSTA